MVNKNALTEFERGVLYAAYLICELHDDPTVAGDVIREANLDSADIRQLDDTEYNVLRQLNASEHLKLKLK
ncbi:hypothetical protein [Erwinia amylovora]|uniref:hypothetical protein n=1 Tax=Erwinia amylovora TaxID=552 RepID=UPI0020C11791|nr:hypothetical protein [Erwinia amylovora]MCK8417623.1 hypothetical protein [Erwinia amylovora]